jgi:hypothetical protein
MERKRDYSWPLAWLTWERQENACTSHPWTTAAGPKITVLTFAVAVR